MKQAPLVQSLTERYGDLIYDLCTSCVTAQPNAVVALRLILKKLSKSKPDQIYSQHERAWVLAETLRVIQKIEPKSTRITAKERLMNLELVESEPAHLQQSLLSLPLTDRVLVILSDKLNVPLGEIAEAMRLSVDSLKYKRAAALKAIHSHLSRMTASPCTELNRFHSDVIDQSLSPSDQKTVTQHCTQCEDCTQQLEGLRSLKKKIAQLPRHAIPQAIRQSPLHFVLPRAGAIMKTGSTPNDGRHLRSTLTVSLLGLVVFGVFSTLPKLKRSMETNLDEKVNQYQASTPGHQLENIGLANAPPLTEGAEITAEQGDEAEDEGTDEAEEKTPASKAASRYIWRYNFRSDMPTEFQQKISGLLKRMDLSAEPYSIPGGFQFDAQPTENQLEQLRSQLETLGKAMPSVKAGSTELPGYTWYKSANKSPPTGGKVRVVIWVSHY